MNIGYVLVSTEEQEVKNQELEIKYIPKHNYFKVFK